MSQSKLSSFFGASVGKKRGNRPTEETPPIKKVRVDQVKNMEKNKENQPQTTLKRGKEETEKIEEITGEIVIESKVEEKAELVEETVKTEITEETVVKVEVKLEVNPFLEKEIKWRQQLPEYVEPREPMPSNSTVLQATQQAHKYKVSKYSPQTAQWKKGEPVPYCIVANVLNQIEQTSKRLEIIELYSQLLRTVIATTPSDLLKVIYLCTNQVAPTYAGIELGIGESLLMKAIAQSTQNTMKAIKGLYQVKGDLGTVAKECRTAQRTLVQPKPLTVRKVFDSFYEIALMKGASSTERKVASIKALLIACKEHESTYIIRSLQGKLRIGLAGQSVLIAIAHAFYLTPPNPDKSQDEFVTSYDTSKKSSENQLQHNLLYAESIVKQAYYQLPSFELMIPQLLTGNLYVLKEVCPLTPGIPLKPMLAHPTKGISEVLQRFEKMTFTCEYKYDGERAQIHYLPNGTIKIYSRNAEDNTTKFPDIIELIPKVQKESTLSFVIDCEAVAFDVATKRILPFQILSTRGKKSVQTEDIKVQVCLFAFDILYLNDKSFLQEPLQTRREALYDAFTEMEGKFLFATHMETSNTEDIEAFLNKSVEDLCEGLMVKTLDIDASYEPSKRSYNWLKLKKDYLSDMGDSLDLVVIGGYLGRGKRTGVYGGFLLACYDNENEEYQSICKIGTGFSDADLQNFSASLKCKEINVVPSYYNMPDRDLPDVWFSPSVVFEVKAADLSISPNHKAAIGLVDPGKGISLRFPRFIRVREDKNPEDATDAEQVAAMYNNQANKTVAFAGEAEDW